MPAACDMPTAETKWPGGLTLRLVGLTAPLSLGLSIGGLGARLQEVPSGRILRLVGLTEPLSLALSIGGLGARLRGVPSGLL